MSTPPDRQSERQSRDTPVDPLVAELRTFMLSYGDHDAECPGRDAVGPDAISGAFCTCGFIGRMNELLGDVAQRSEER